MQQGTVTLADLPALEREYERAVEDGDTEFTFQGSVLLTSYAKYLIEHMHNMKAKHEKRV